MREGTLVCVGDTKGGRPLGKALRVVVEGISKMNIETAVHLKLLNFAPVHDNVMLQVIFDNPVKDKISIESLRKIIFYTDKKV